ncbi:hypothetical protein FGU65_02980 [Methanoculleus sp. FWC-SCC1]|uniref:DUF4352 domain-containing protein n=1 Tax=Methanoculleus frigidifontis TaxID=2584085 RepID=A0ABT8M7F3_9EURY|nr:hypothetical protein [Methanoculleus sp. FWC-SCC1]MDN7023864.1 hypothetical protein [Methanoculleus sp. FWC-SCC1]
MRIGYVLLIVLTVAGLLGGATVALFAPHGADQGARQIQNASAGASDADLLELPFPVNLFTAVLPPGDEPADNVTFIPEENSSLPLSGDDALAALISDTGISLPALSVQTIHAVYYGDAGSLADSAEELSALSASALSDAEDCDVSPGNESVREEYMAAMEEFLAAGDLLAGMASPDRAAIETAFDHIALGTERLREAMRLYNEELIAIPAEPSLLLVEPEPSPTPAYPDALGLMERHCHEYPSGKGSNVLSLIVDSTEERHVFTAKDGSRKRFEAESGRTYLLVVIRSAHIGFRGDGKSSSIRLPAPSAFTLLYGGESYTLMTGIPTATSEGETYTGGVLAIEETDTGYLFFDVPDSLNTSEAYLKANLGTAAPVWRLEPLR